MEGMIVEKLTEAKIGDVVPFEHFMETALRYGGKFYTCRLDGLSYCDLPTLTFRLKEENGKIIGYERIE